MFLKYKIFFIFLMFNAFLFSSHQNSDDFSEREYIQSSLSFLYPAFNEPYSAWLYNTYVQDKERDAVIEAKISSPPQISPLFDYSFTFQTLESCTLLQDPTVVYQQFLDISLSLKKVLACCLCKNLCSYEVSILFYVFNAQYNVLKKMYNDFIQNDCLFNNPLWNSEHKNNILELKKIVQYDFMLSPYIEITKYIACILDTFVFTKGLFINLEMSEIECSKWLVLTINPAIGLNKELFLSFYDQHFSKRKTDENIVYKSDIIIDLYYKSYFQKA
ncbi:MAG: hypothetical protein HEEMFOPI_01433 [Holosporales bacterium]